MITGQFLHLMWTGILTWMWDSPMLQTQSSIRKPFVSNLCCDSEEALLGGGPSHIWLPHILPGEHLGNKLPTPAHRMVSEEKGRQDVHHRDGPGVHQTCINVSHCSKSGSNEGSWVVSAKASMHTWGRGHISNLSPSILTNLSPSTLRTCFGPSSQEK